MFVLGCTTTNETEQVKRKELNNERFGQFTVISSYNVRNLNYSVDDQTKVRVEGKDCYIRDTKDQNTTPRDARLQRALDNAIRNGQEKGIDGDLLVNVRVDKVEKERKKITTQEEKSFWDRLRGTSKKQENEEYEGIENCYVVTGDLVKMEEQ